MIDKHDICEVLEDLQHDFEQKLINHFPDLDYLEVEELIDSMFDKVYSELKDRELVLVRDDDLSCLEDDYEEACDKLMSIRALAIEGKSYLPSVIDDTDDQDNLESAFINFENIILEVER